MESTQVRIASPSSTAAGAAGAEPASSRWPLRTLAAARQWITAMAPETPVQSSLTRALLIAASALMMGSLLSMFSLGAVGAFGASTTAAAGLLFLVVVHRGSVAGAPAQPAPSPVKARQLVDSRLSSVTTLVAGVTHEVNTPLGALNSNTDLLRRTALKAQELVRGGEHDNRTLERLLASMVDLTGESLRAARRIDRTVQNLGEFARLDRSAVGRIDINLAVERTLGMIRYQLTGRRVAVRQRFGELPLVECYPDRINQMFLNLLLNASQSLGERGQIEIETSLGARGIKVVIRDTGQGIPAAALPQIFDPGFSTRADRRGTGLGLSIVRQIVTDHGGSIDVTSTHGQGTSVRLTLPTSLP